MSDYMLNATQFAATGDYLNSFVVWDKFINGDIWKYGTYVYNVTGTLDYDNAMRTTSPEDFGYFYTFVTSPSVRKAIHVGSQPFNNGWQCECHLFWDIMAPAEGQLEVLLDNYKVLLYNGQVDLIVAPVLTESYIPYIEWSGAAGFAKSARKVWYADPKSVEVSGFVRKYGNFTQAVVRAAGHIVPYDQPEWAYDLITRFVDDVPF